VRWEVERWAVSGCSVKGSGTGQVACMRQMLPAGACSARRRGMGEKCAGQLLYYQRATN